MAGRSLALSSRRRARAWRSVATYTSGQNVSPAYRRLGRRTTTARSDLMFGYMNRNWEEEIDVPVGPDNSFICRRRPTRASRRTSCRAATASCSGARADRLHREGRTGLDADHARQDREGLRHAACRLVVDNVVKASETGALGAGISSPEVRGNHRADRPHPGGQGAHRQGRRAAHRCQRSEGRRDSEAPRAVLGDAAGGATPPRRRSGACRADPQPVDVAAVANHGRQESRASRFVVRVSPAGRREGDLRSAAGEAVGRHARRRQLAVGAAVDRRRRFPTMVCSRRR